MSMTRRNLFASLCAAVAAALGIKDTAGTSDKIDSAHVAYGSDPRSPRGDKVFYGVTLIGVGGQEETHWLPVPLVGRAVRISAVASNSGTYIVYANVDGEVVRMNDTR